MEATPHGDVLRRMYLVETSGKRTVVLDYVDSVKIPDMKSDMKKELKS